MDDNKLFRSLKGQLSPDEQASIEAWRKRCLEHERRYRELAAVLAAATPREKDVESTPPSPLKLIHQAETLARMNRSASSRERRWWQTLEPWPRWGLAAAAVLVLSLALGLGTVARVSDTPISGFEAEEFVTGAAETATVTLRDGTVIRLGPQTRLRVIPGEGRGVSMRGRALFSVAKDPYRPFWIETAEGSVNVLGTRFELETRADELRVAVLEGRVALSARGLRTEVSAGELCQVVGGVTLPPVPIPDDFTVADWAGKFLAFQNTPLQEAAREITDLYGVEIDIPDSSLAGHTITAWFADEPLEQVMRIFCMVAQAHCVTTEDGSITLDPRERG